MANEKVTQLPTVEESLLTDIIYAVQGGVSVQENLSQVSNLVASQIVLSYAGNPNGNVAGTVNQLCWDTSETMLFICTSAGSTVTAVWVPVIGQLTNGQLNIGSTGNTPVKSTLTAGDNIVITNAAGSITITAPGFPWNDITSTTYTLTTDAGFVADSASLVTFTLPTTAAFGTVIYIQGFGLGGWKVAQNSGQKIIIGDQSTTVGVGGYIASSNQYDSLTLLCVVADTTWVSFGGPQGDITLI